MAETCSPKLYLILYLYEVEQPFVVLVIFNGSGMSHLKITEVKWGDLDGHGVVPHGQLKRQGNIYPGNGQEEM